MQRIKTVVGLATIALFSSLTMAEPSFAATDGNCGSGEICMYFNYFADGTMYDTGSSLSNFAGKKFYGSALDLNDNVASARSRALIVNFFLCEDANYNGANLKIGPGATDTSLGAMANQASSEYWDLYRGERPPRAWPVLTDPFFRLMDPS